MDLKNFEWLFEDGIRFAVNLGFALLIIAIGFWLSSRVRKILRNRMIKREVDPSFREFVLPIVDFVFKLFVVVTAIGTVGIKVTSFAAILAGLAAGVGLSLQGSLSNFAGGLLIIFFKPFKVGDFIEAQSQSGTVRSISILYTTLVTVQQQMVVLPNAALLNGPIKNYSVLPIRRLDIKIGLSYGEDLNRALSLLREMFEQEPKILKAKEITVEVDEFTDTRIKLALYAFTKSEDYWETYYKLHKRAIELLTAQDISITPTPAKMIVEDKKH